MTDLDRAAKAATLLQSPMFVEGFDLVRTAIVDSIERCSLNDTETAEDLRRSLKLLRDLKLNFITAVNAGKLDAYRIEQDKKRRDNPLRHFFR